jgi:hypothetical protein
MGTFFSDEVFIIDPYNITIENKPPKTDVIVG